MYGCGVLPRANNPAVAVVDVDIAVSRATRGAGEHDSSPGPSRGTSLTSSANSNEVRVDGSCEISSSGGVKMH